MMVVPLCYTFIVLFNAKMLCDTVGGHSPDSENEFQLSEDDVGDRKIHSEGSLMTRSAARVNEPVNFGMLFCN